MLHGAVAAENQVVEVGAVAGISDSAAASRPLTVSRMWPVSSSRPSSACWVWRMRLMTSAPRDDLSVERGLRSSLPLFRSGVEDH